jgi:hypothetical protein
MAGERFIPCPANQTDCKYRNTPDGCHVGEHHLFPRRTAETRLQRLFGNLACNKVIVCRNIHDTLDTFPPPAYPDEATMIARWEAVRHKEWKP